MCSEIASPSPGTSCQIVMGPERDGGLERWGGGQWGG